MLKSLEIFEIKYMYVPILKWNFLFRTHPDYLVIRDVCATVGNSAVLLHVLGDLQNLKILMSVVLRRFQSKPVTKECERSPEHWLITDT